MDDKLQVLESVSFLASLGKDLMESLAERAELVAAKKGDLVVRENDPGDAFYTVVSGRLQAFTRLGSGRERVFATYCDGDCFGEMPLLSGETQWASVRAANDSVLLKIPRDDFNAVVNRDPRVAIGFTRRLGLRIKELREEKHRAKASKIISLYSAVPGAGKTLLATNLIASLAQETGVPVLMLDFSGRQPGSELGSSVRFGSSNGSALQELVVHHPLGYDRLNLHLRGDEKEIHLIAPLFGRLVKQYDYVLVDLPNEASASVMECLIQSDQIYAITRNEDEHLHKTRQLLQELRELAPGRSVEAKARVILTAVSNECAPTVVHAEQKVGQEIRYLLRWISSSERLETLEGVPYVLHRPMESYSLVVRRIARELSNSLVGLALGSGAARGLAHIGVIRVLEREGIGVDIVAGSSMGSLIAAAWAVGKSADEMERIARQVKGKRAFLKLLDPVFPGAGFLRGIKVYDFLRSIVDELTFADTLIPLMIVAADLDTNEEVVFEDGRLIDAIRASISIPGVFRPVMNKGRTLIDGGIADPVPVQVLAKAGVGRIIAVNTIANSEEMKQRKQQLAAGASAQAGEGGVHETGPVIETPRSIINIYMRSMATLQSHLAEDACTHADVVMRPAVTDSVWYDFYHPDKYIRSGEQAAEASLARLKELVRP